jgi:phosphoribosylformylglycinamidine synthase
VEAAKRPNVQVGDPFEEKRLIEACLQLLDEGLVVGIQDLGGAGLTCATSETASRGQVGMDVDVTAVPRREPGMEPWEVMTSESQERMLAIVTPDAADRVLEVCRRWEVQATVVGRVTAGGRLRILDGWQGQALADVPATTLHEDAPVYHRPMAPPAGLAARQADDPNRLPHPADCGADLLRLLMDPSWVYQQYDHQLFLNTVTAPGGDAALLRLAAPGVPPARGATPTRGVTPAAGTRTAPGVAPTPGVASTAPHERRGLALSTDGNARWCALDPRAGTALVVAESTLNVACAGARPVAIVNCLNFGNPEHPEVMWQLSEAIDGMGEACRALSVPVVGGNVSLYNESRGRDIDPTPVVGTLGLVDRLDRRPPGPALVAASSIVLIGAVAGAVSLAGSRWAVELHGHRGGPLPALDLDLHARLLAVVAGLVNDDLVDGIHDLSEGGLGVALAEMAVRSQVGFQVEGIPDHAELFGEGPSRVVLSVPASALDEVRTRVTAAGLGWTPLGMGGGDRLAVDGLLDVLLAEATAAWQGALPEALGTLAAAEPGGSPARPGTPS